MNNCILHTIRPKITIITVVFNSVDLIEKTILSVIEQVNVNVEYIVIDGGSSDGTVGVINKYLEKIDVFVSEKDSGIYFAMNKGIELATGHWINFLNAGDSLLFDLQELYLYNNNSTPFLYGTAIVKDIHGHELYKSGRKILKSDFLDSMPICHQAIFYSCTFLINYNLNYKIIADRVMTYNILNEKHIPVFDDKIIVEYLEGGLSYKSIKLRVREEIMFLREVNNLTFRRLFSIIFTYYIKLPIYNKIRSIQTISHIYSFVKN